MASPSVRFVYGDEGSAEGENKKPSVPKSARRVSENLLGNSKSSLAVFYVEQVALNRHVSVDRRRPTRRRLQLHLLCLRTKDLSSAFVVRGRAIHGSQPGGSQCSADEAKSMTRRQDADATRKTPER